MNRKILLIGYGNPARGDDGLGPAVAQTAEAWKLPHVTVDSAYQLTVEDAVSVAQHDAVVFVDASVTGAEPFRFDRVQPGPDGGFSTHHVEPAAVMTLAASLFHASTEGYVLGIRGYQFEMFCEALSDGALLNFEAAIAFLEPLLRQGLPRTEAQAALEAAGGRQGEP